MTITIGSSGIPAAITVALLFVTVWRYERAKRFDGSGFLGDMGSAFTLMFWLATTAIISLSAWLIWALTKG